MGGACGAVRADLYPSGLGTASTVWESEQYLLPQAEELHKVFKCLVTVEPVTCTPLTHLPVHFHVHCGHHLHKVLEHHGRCVEKEAQGVGAGQF